MTPQVKTGITIQMQNYFARISENVSILSGTYLNDPTNNNFKENAKHLHGGDTEKMARLNPGSHIGEVIKDKVSNFIGEPREEVEINLLPSIVSLLTTGYILVQKTKRKGAYKITDIDCTKYYFDGNIETIIEIYEEESSDLINTKKYFLYVQQFLNGRITNRLFEITKGNYTMGQPVPLSRIPVLADRPEEQIVDFERLVTRIYVEDSIVEKVKPIIYSLDRKLAEADKQYNRYTEQFKVFDNIDIPQKAYKNITYAGTTYKVVDFDKLGSLVTTNSELGSGDIKIIENTNKLLQESFEMYERQIKQISVITDIPLYFFGVDSNLGNDSGTSKTKDSEAFYKRIDRYRNLLKKAIAITFEEVGLKAPQITFPPLVENDEAVVLENLRIKQELGITTKFRMIQELYGTTDQETQAILNEIQNEINTNPIAGAIQGENQ